MQLILDELKIIRSYIYHYNTNMATFTLDLPNVTTAIDNALWEWARVLQSEIIKITPRDPARLPKDPSRKVTGNLKRSIQYEKVSWTHYKVWVVWAWVRWDRVISSWKWATPSEYWIYLEFWTIRMKPRSFIRKALIEQKQNIEKIINKVFRLFIK